MPIHDWSRVDAGTFHHFHQAWTIEITYALNGGELPPRFFAMAEQAVVPAPLEATYQTTWAKCPEVIRELVENPEAAAD